MQPEVAKRVADWPNAPLRLEFLEFLLGCEDTQECAQRALEWMAEHCGIQRALCAASNDPSRLEAIAAVVANAPGADEQLDAARTRAVLDGLLAQMPIELRTVFVLYEIEEMTMAEMATMLELPPGTVASRLRRSRERFQELGRHAQAAMISPEPGASR